MFVHLVTTLIFLVSFVRAIPLVPTTSPITLADLPLEMILSITNHLNDQSFGAFLATHSFYLNSVPLHSIDQACALLENLCVDGKESVAHEMLKNLSSDDTFRFLLQAIYHLHYQLVRLLWLNYICDKECAIMKILSFCVRYDRFQLFKYFLSFLKDTSDSYEKVLNEAIQYERHEMIHELLDSTDWSLSLRFYYSVILNNVQQLKVLQQEFLQSDLDASVFFKNFEVACEYDHVQVVQWFMNETNFMKYDSVENDIIYEGFLKACHNGAENVVRFLLQHLDPSFDNNTAIAIATESGHYQIISLLLADQRVNPYETKATHCALTVAAELGDLEIVQFILYHRNHLDLTEGSLLKKLALVEMPNVLEYILAYASISSPTPIIDAIVSCMQNGLTENKQVLLNALIIKGFVTNDATKFMDYFNRIELVQWQEYIHNSYELKPQNLKIPSQ